MEHELKIIISGDGLTEDFKIFVDNNQIGFVKKVIIGADANDIYSNIEIEMFDFSQNQYRNTASEKSIIELENAKFIEVLKSFPHIKLTLLSLDKI